MYVVKKRKKLRIIYKVTRLYKDCSTVIFSTDKTHKRDTYAEILATHLVESWTHHSHLGLTICLPKITGKTHDFWL